MIWTTSCLRRWIRCARPRPTPLAATVQAAFDETDAELRRLTDCLGLLKEPQRECILMVYHQGYTPTEVSHRRSHPIGTVKTWIRRGLAQLRDCMRR